MTDEKRSSMSMRVGQNVPDKSTGIAGQVKGSVALVRKVPGVLMGCKYHDHSSKSTRVSVKGRQACVHK